MCNYVITFKVKDNGQPIVNWECRNENSTAARVDSIEQLRQACVYLHIRLCDWEVFAPQE